MAHSPAQSLPDFEGFPQTKTLFINTETPRAILSIHDGEFFRKEEMMFDDPHVALNWCLSNGACLVMQNEASDPTRN